MSTEFHDEGPLDNEEREVTLRHVGRRNWQSNPLHHTLRAIAGVMGNVLEWYVQLRRLRSSAFLELKTNLILPSSLYNLCVRYDFAVFGFFSVSFQ
jgi:hypothetical protein